MPKDNRRAGLMALAMMLAGTAAHAEKKDFERCDGLKAPAATSQDGMAPTMLPAPLAMPGQEQTVITACTAALADPHLAPAQALRRIHLLQARALWKLQAADPVGALADLDAADGAAGPLAVEPLYRRSLGLSLLLVRSAALQASGDGAQARTIALRAAALRPYSASVQSIGAALVQASLADGGATADQPYLHVLPLVPDALNLQFLADMDAGRFAEARILYPRLKTDFPQTAAGPVLTPAVMPLANRLGHATLLAGTGAYASAATDDPAGARAILRQARSMLDGALAPPPTVDGAPPSSNGLSEPLHRLLDRWTMLAEARIAIDEHRPQDALKALVGVDLPPNAVSLDLVTALQAALPAAQRGLAPDPRDMAARLREGRKKSHVDYAALRRALPAPELGSQMAEYQKAGSPFLTGLFGASPDGFRSDTDAATGITTVEFLGQSSSAPIVEELTLLRAADLATHAGKSALLIVERHDYSRTMTTYYGYARVPIKSRPAGYKTDIKVRFVSPASLPPDLVAERDRLLNAGDVYRALAPIYIGAGAPR